MALPEQYRDTGFVLHPALLDAALHTVALAAPDTERAVLPFSFRAVTATGVANPDTLRVRLVRQADDTYGVQLADASGAPLAAIPALVLRPVDPAQLAAAGPRPADLYRMDWAELPLSGQPAEPYAVIGTDVPQVPGGHGAPYPDLSALAAAFDAGAEVPATVLVGCPPAEGEPAEATRRAVHHALELAQEWLRDERFSASRLVLCTRDAVADRAGAAVPGLAQSAVWGLIRTAKAENPGRFALLDHDGTAQSAAALPAALATGEPETALRAGAARVPRLVRARTAHPFKGLGADGTVLITGAGGMLGRLVARHLVAAHGVRSLLLASRRGRTAEGMAELEKELRELGAEVDIAACDLADRDDTARLLASVSAERPLTAVVHTAGVLDDGVIGSLTADRMDTVLRAKADAVLHLDELTRDLDLMGFVLFSSLAGTFGGVGQGNYAAANAFLDAFAHARRAAGRPAVSLAWGLWAERSGMTTKLDETDLHRMARGGVRPMPSEQALALLDAALATEEPFLVPARLDMAALQSAAGETPALLRSLTGPRPRTPSAGRAPRPPRSRTARHPPRRAAGDGPAPGGARRRPGPSRAGPGAYLGRCHRPRTRLPGPGIRLADRRRATQPSHHRDRDEAARDPAVRLPRTGRTGRSPARQAGRRSGATAAPQRLRIRSARRLGGTDRAAHGRHGRQGIAAQPAPGTHGPARQPPRGRGRRVGEPVGPSVGRRAVRLHREGTRRIVSR